MGISSKSVGEGDSLFTPLPNKKVDLEKLFREFEDVVNECIKKGLAAEMILIEGLPNLRRKYEGF